MPNKPSVQVSKVTKWSLPLCFSHHVEHLRSIRLHTLLSRLFLQESRRMAGHSSGLGHFKVWKCAKWEIIKVRAFLGGRDQLPPTNQISKTVSAIWYTCNWIKTKFHRGHKRMSSLLQSSSGFPFSRLVRQLSCDHDNHSKYKTYNRTPYTTDWSIQQTSCGRKALWEIAGPWRSSSARGNQVASQAAALCPRWRWDLANCTAVFLS